MMTRQMLPSSHSLLIKTPPADGAGRRQGPSWAVDAILSENTVSQNGAPEPMRPQSALALASAFSEFIAVSSRLEDSYRDLQQQVCELSLELAKRNAALQQSQAENERMRLALEQIVSCMPCGVLVLKADGEIAMLNPEARRLLELDGRVEADRLSTLEQLSAAAGIDFDSFLINGDGGESAREFCLPQTNTARWLEVRNRRLADGAEEAESGSQTILILRDVTAQKRAEQDREAGRSAMALAELGAVLAHEIRNPLASLELFSELIEKDEAGRGQWISHLRAGVRSLSTTANNVLSFHSGALSLEPLELSAAIGNALDFAGPIVAQAGIGLETHLESQPAWIMGNGSALQQLVLNLVANATRHTPTGGRIAVSLFHDEPSEQVRVEFADNGCGIEPEEMEKIFNPGFTGTGESSGLGLAVCERIMNRHGGRIRAANGAHGGAVFTLCFPLLEPEAEAQ